MCELKRREGFRLLSFLLAFVMIATGTAGFDSAKAEEQPTAGNIPALVDGVYQIETAEHLMWFRDLTNGKAKNAEGELLEQNLSANAKLIKDIDLSTHLGGDNHWESIAANPKYNPEIEYKGTFDGNGKKITGFLMTTSPLFDGNAGVIKHLYVEGIFDSKQGKSHSFLTRYNVGVIIACSLKVKIKYFYSPMSGMGGSLYGGNAERGAIAYCKSECEADDKYKIAAISHGKGSVYSCYSKVNNLDVGVVRTGGVPHIRNCYSNAAIMSIYNDNLRYVFNNYRISEKNELPVHRDKYFHPVFYSSENLKSQKSVTAKELGDGFVDDVENENGGLPLLKWEKTGVCPELEPKFEGVEVTDIKDFYIDRFEFELNRHFKYTPIKAEDFIVKIKIEDEDEKIIECNGLRVDGNKVTINFKKVLSEFFEGSDKNVTVEVTPQSGIGKSKEFTVKGIEYWDDHAEPAEKIGKADGKFPEYEGYYAIDKPEKMVWFAKLVNGTLEDREAEPKAKAFLTNDISFNEVGDFEKLSISTKGLRHWRETVGNDESKFGGHFDGNGYKIKGLFLIKNDKTPYISPFGYIKGAKITDLTVEDSFYGCLEPKDSYNRVYVGGIVSTAEKSKIRNCNFKGKIVGEKFSILGGIFGRSREQNIVKNVSSQGILHGEQVGGIGGSFTYIYDSYSLATIDSGYGASIIVDGRAINSYSIEPAIFFNINSEGPKNSYCLKGSIAYKRNIKQEESNTDEPIEFDFEERTSLHEKLGNAFVADEFGVNNGYPILKSQVPSYYASRHAIQELKGYMDYRDYITNKKQVDSVIGEYTDKILKEADVLKIKQLLDEGKAKLDEIKSDEAIKEEKNKEYLENEKKLKEEKEKIKELEKELKDLIAKYNFSSSSFRLKKTVLAYSGKIVKPVVTARAEDGKVLKENMDFKVVYPSSRKPGSWKLKIVGIGDYSGEKNLYYKIVPAKAKLRYLKRLGKGRIKASWYKRSEADGYRISYSYSRNFKSEKTVKVSGRYTQTVIKGLKKGRKLYVRIRGVKTVKSVKYYGEWSGSRAITAR